MNKDINKNNKFDHLTTVTKGVLGMIPVGGSLLSEIAGSIIPNQRLDRFGEFLKALEQRLSLIEEKVLAEQVSNHECIDLFEEAFIHASRAMSQVKRGYIADILANGISAERIEYSNSKVLLKLIAELNEQEIIFLKFYANSGANKDENFYERHKKVIQRIHVHITSPQQDVDRAAIQSSYREHLERLGLVKRRFKIDKKTGLPKFNTQGEPEYSNPRITNLGSLLLKNINILS
ncbi:hypothetical protein [Acanthopleuribacter pedis]|uniref:Uncharacterized protein n=1 Tax=Acanthopleuribacter pedis TaxID=442870 RepID=A0A8J7U4I2_9BACT|nr:hypothetical protein [Acanthopleuribacter pedis]MBO1318321.1 hypothetical protein [Acanthopleuribacter pedis]